MMQSRCLATMVLVLVMGSVSRADDKPLDRTDLDRRIVKIVYQSALLGTDIFNKGDHEGCFRLYQGTLLAVQPLLDHRPKLAEMAKEKLDKARTMSAADGAFVLREGLDAIQNEIAPNSDAPVPKKEEPKKTTLWDRLGGEDGVKKIVHDFVLVAAEDPTVKYFRDQKLDGKGVAAVEQSLVSLVSYLSGGPLKYEKKDLNWVHLGPTVTAEEFDAALALLKKSLEKFEVPKADIDELLKRFAITKASIVKKED